MFFNSTAEQQQHPEAGLIPYMVWSIYGFNDADTTRPFFYMSQSIETLIQSPVAQIHAMDALEKTHCFLAVAFRHLDITNENLMRVAHHLDLDDADLFNCLATLGKLDLLISLAKEGRTPKTPKAVNEIFRQATLFNHIDILKHMAQSLADFFPKRIADEHYYAITLASLAGNLDILKYLVECSSDNLSTIIAAGNYLAFAKAAENGHLHVVKYLTESLPNDLTRMLAAANYAALRMAAIQKQVPVVQYLLHYSSVFAHAEMYTNEYQQYTQPFVTEELASLQQRRRAFEELHPNMDFNIEDNNETKLYFYILRNLIRKNDPSLRDDILLLLGIPSVKTLLHRAVTPHEENELVRLALRLGNEMAAELLLKIPAVLALAQQNDHYQDEIRNGVDVRALAQDQESSMRALSTAEQKRLERATNHYAPEINASTVNTIINQLRDTLIVRYKANPAKFIDDAGNTRLLPMSWGSFMAQGFSIEIRSGSLSEHQRALQAYYQHKDHTAFRFLLKPNPWIHKNASYVYVNEAHTELWSTFEDYQPLIAMLFLAATDKNTPACDGHTLETRTEHFINELAYIERAHNWDEKRIVCDTEFNPLTDDLGNVITEEYDNLDADRPSCYSGIKNRLLQSVLGHPLLSLLTTAIVSQKLDELIRDHFQRAIHVGNRETLKQAWQDHTNDDLDYTARQNALQTLKTLNITQAQKKAILQTLAHELNKTYGEQFNDDENFLKKANNLLTLDKHDKSATHATQFAYLEWMQWLEVTPASLNTALGKLKYLHVTPSLRPHLARFIKTVERAFADTPIDLLQKTVEKTYQLLTDNSSSLLEYHKTAKAMRINPNPKLQVLGAIMLTIGALIAIALITTAILGLPLSSFVLAPTIGISALTFGLGSYSLFAGREKRLYKDMNCITEAEEARRGLA